MLIPKIRQPDVPEDGWFRLAALPWAFFLHFGIQVFAICLFGWPIRLTMHGLRLLLRGRGAAIGLAMRAVAYRRPKPFDDVKIFA